MYSTPEKPLECKFWVPKLAPALLPMAFTASVAPPELYSVNPFAVVPNESKYVGLVVPIPALPLEGNVLVCAIPFTKGKGESMRYRKYFFILKNYLIRGFVIWVQGLAKSR